MKKLKISEAEKRIRKAQDENGFGPRVQKLVDLILKENPASWDRWLFFLCLAMDLESELNEAISTIDKYKKEIETQSKQISQTT